MGATLRPIDEKDSEVLRRWRESELVKPYLREFKPHDEERQKNWYYSLTEDNDDILFVIGWDYENSITAIKSIGCGGIVRIDWKNRKGEISFFIGERDFANNHYIKDSLQKIIDYGLKELNLHKLYFPVYEFNPFLQTYREVMDLDYVASDEFYRFGAYWDRIVLSTFQTHDKEEENTSVGT